MKYFGVSLYGGLSLRAALYFAGLAAFIYISFGIMPAPADAQDVDEPSAEAPDQDAPEEETPDDTQPEEAAPEETPSDTQPEETAPEEAPSDKPPADAPAEPVPVEEVQPVELSSEAPPTADNATEVEKMVVTAQFREQNPQDTPLAITVVDGEMMAKRSQDDISQIADQAPNVKLGPASSIYGPSMQAFIRGVGQYDFNYALEPGVGIYVDDVYYSTLTGSIIDLLDIDRVEVLRGPQGTLAGQNSIGGAIKLYSKPPDGEGGGFVETIYGRYNRTELRGAGNFTVIDDMLFGRISGVGKHKDGYVTRYDYACTHHGTNVPSYQTSDSCKLGTEGGKSYAATRASFRFVPIDEIDVNLIGDYTNDNSEATPTTLLYVGGMEGPGLMMDPMTGGTAPYANHYINGVPLGTATGSQFISYSPFGNWAQDPYSDSPYINYSTYTDPAPIDGSGAPYSVPPDYQVDSGGVSGKIDIDLNEYLLLTSISAYRGYDGAWSVEDGTPISAFLLRNRVDHDQFTEELRLHAKLLDDTVNLTLGGFLLSAESHYGGRVGLTQLSFVEDSDKIEDNTYAVFGNADWEVIKGLNLIAGARYTNQKKVFTYQRGAVDSLDTHPFVAPLDGLVGEFEGDQVDWRGAIQYRWIPELMTYFQVATGFKGGGVNPRPYYEDQVLPHDPETLTGFEIGAKTDVLEKRLRVNLAGFVNLYDDIQMNVAVCPAPSTPQPCFMPINAGAATVMGGELEAMVSPVKEMAIDGSLALLKFEYTNISDDGASSGITEDMSAPFSPELQASLGAQYDIYMGPEQSEWGILTPRLDLVYRDEFYSESANSEFSKLDAHVLLNGRLTWSSYDELWQAALEVTNITNQLYYYSINDNRASSGTVTGNPAPPIEWAVSLRRNFF